MERVAPVGYINEDRLHALISIYDPALLNAYNKDAVQVAITIDTAIELRAELNRFLEQHGITAQ